MKNIFSFLIGLCLFAGSANALNCKEFAERAVEIREDYKSYQEFENQYIVSMAQAERMGDTKAGITLRYDLQRDRNTAEFVFTVAELAGVKGKKLYKKIYDACMRNEKDAAARALRQEAREAAKAEKNQAKP